MESKGIIARLLIMDEKDNNIVSSFSTDDFEKLGFVDEVVIDKGKVIEILGDKFEVLEVYFIPTKFNQVLMGISDCEELSESRPFNLDIRVIVKKI